MVTQATSIECTGRPPSPTEVVKSDLSGIGSDLMTLAELQAQLLAVDCAEASKQIRLSVVAFAVGFLLILGCMPVVLTGFAFLLVQYAGWSIAASLLATSAAAVAIAVAGILFGWREVRATVTVMNRSREEFGRNFRWIRDTLARQTNGR